MAKEKERLATNCEECPVWELIPPDDTPTQIAGLGWRFLFSAGSILTLGLNVKPQNQTAFFTSYLLYSLPLLREYMGFKPKDTKRKVVNFLERLVIGFVFAVSVAGLFGILVIGEKGGVIHILVNQDYVVLSNQGIPHRWLWYVGGLSVLLTIADIFAYKPSNPQTIQKPESMASIT